jgi:FeS assembly SUF system protein
VADERAEDLEKRIIAAIREVYDPEIPVNIYDLGLIYGIDVKSGGQVAITMTLTSPACPVAKTLPPQVGEKVANVEGVEDVNIHVVWDPPWSPDRMSEAARLQLGML